MSILPNDICRLRSIINLNLLTKECTPILELFIIVNNFIIVLCSVQAFLTLKAQESRYWSTDVLMLLLLNIVNLVVYFSHLVELKVLDTCTA